MSHPEIPKSQWVKEMQIRNQAIKVKRQQIAEDQAEILKLEEELIDLIAQGFIITPSDS